MAAACCGDRRALARSGRLLIQPLMRHRWPQIPFLAGVQRPKALGRPAAADQPVPAWWAEDRSEVWAVAPAATRSRAC